MDRPQTAAPSTRDHAALMADMAAADAQRKQVAQQCCDAPVSAMSWRLPQPLHQANQSAVQACWTSLVAGVDPGQVWHVLSQAYAWHRTGNAASPSINLLHSHMEIKASDVMEAYARGPQDHMERVDAVMEHASCLRMLVTRCLENPQESWIASACASTQRPECADWSGPGFIIAMAARIGSACSGRASSCGHMNDDAQAWCITAHPQALVAWRDEPCCVRYASSADRLDAMEEQPIALLSGPDGDQHRSACLASLRQHEQWLAAITDRHKRPASVVRHLAKCMLAHHAQGLSTSDLQTCMQMAHGYVQDEHRRVGHGAISLDVLRRLVVTHRPEDVARIMPMLPAKGSSVWAKQTGLILGSHGDTKATATAIIARHDGDMTTKIRIASAVNPHVAKKQAEVCVPRLGSLPVFDVTASSLKRLLANMKTPEAIMRFMAEEPFVTTASDSPMQDSIPMPASRIDVLRDWMADAFAKHPDAMLSGLSQRRAPLGQAAIMAIGEGCQDDRVWDHLIRCGRSNHTSQYDADMPADRILERMSSMPVHVAHALPLMTDGDQRFNQAAGHLYASHASGMDRSRHLATIACEHQGQDAEAWYEHRLVGSGEFLRMATLGTPHRLAIQDLYGKAQVIPHDRVAAHYVALIRDMPDLAPRIQALVLQQTISSTGDDAVRAGAILAAISTS